MFPDGPGFLWNRGDSIPWSNQMEGTFIHPFFAMFSSHFDGGALPLLPDSSLPLTSRVCCVVPRLSRDLATLQQMRQEALRPDVVSALRAYSVETWRPKRNTKSEELACAITCATDTHMLGVQESVV